MIRSILLFGIASFLTFNSLAQSGADPAVTANTLTPNPLENVGSQFTVGFTIGNSGAAPITGSGTLASATRSLPAGRGSVTATVSGPERMGFVIQLQQCAPNPASDPLSAISGTILNSFDITYNSSLNRYEGVQKEGVSLGFATVRRLNIAATATQPSASTTVNTIGAYCVIFPNSNAEPQPEDDDFSEILTHTKTTSPLPVGLVSFSAEAQSNRTVLVKWVTSWEKANKGYIIERSKDLKNFEDIGRVTDVAGTTNSKSSYQFEDPNPYRGTSYYRLRQLDLSGGSETFKAESVVIDGRYGVYPNPVASHNFTLELDEPTTAVLHFYSASGSEISVSKSEPTELSTKVTPSAKLTSGVYVLTVEERGTTRKHRLVVQ